MGGIANTEAQSRRLINNLLALIAFIIGVWFLRATYEVTMPLALGFFVALIVRPLQQWLGSHLPSRLYWLSLVLTILTVVGAILLVLWLIWLSVSLIVNHGAELRGLVQRDWEHLVRWARSHRVPIPADLTQAGKMEGLLVGLVTQAIESFWSVLFYLAIMLFLALLLLIEWDDWRTKAQQAFPPNQSLAMIDTVHTMGERFRHYLLVRTFIAGISGVTDGVWLWAFGVDLAFVWGLLFFLLNYIPNVGSVIAMVPPTLIILAQYGFRWALIIVGGFAVIESVNSNYIAPRLHARHQAISSTVILMSILFWGWVWGVPGSILGVPLTVLAVHACARVPALNFVALLLARNPESKAETVREESQDQGGPR